MLYLSNSIHTCNNGAIAAQETLGVVNNSYISQLNIHVHVGFIVSPELNNKTVECVHSYNFTEVVVRSIQIIVLATGK